MSERACVGKRKRGENRKITIYKEDSLAKDTDPREKKGVANCLVTFSSKVNIERHSAVNIMLKLY